MTLIERIYADFGKITDFGFIRVNPNRSDLIRVPLPLFIVFYLVSATLPQESLIC